MSWLRDHLRVAKATKAMRQECVSRRAVLQATLAMTLALYGARQSEAASSRGSSAGAAPSITHVTNKRTGQTYDYIPQAIHDAQEGDTILLPAGLYSAPGIPYAHYRNTDSSAFGHTTAWNCMYLGPTPGFGPSVLTLQGVGTANGGRARIQRPFCRTSAASKNTDKVVRVEDPSLIHPAYPNDSFGAWGENAAIQNVNGGFGFVVSSVDTVNRTITGAWQNAPAVIPAGTLLTNDTVNGQGIFATYGREHTFVNLEICGACGSGNSNAVRMGYGLDRSGRAVGSYTLRNCYIHDCQSGFVGNASPLGAGVFCRMYNTEIYRCGNPGHGTTHNLYTQEIDEFTMIGCYSHYTSDAHLVKTRARKNVILYNRITGENPQVGNNSGVYGPSGTYSCNIDVSQGGYTLIIGNMFEQSAQQRNVTINYNPESWAGFRNGSNGNAGEGGNIANPNQECYVVNNTAVSNYNFGKVPPNTWAFVNKIYPYAVSGKTSILFPPEDPTPGTAPGGALPHRTYFSKATLVDVNGTETPHNGSGLSSAGQLYTGITVTSYFSCGTLSTPGANQRLALASPVARTGAKGWHAYLGLPPPPQAQLAQVAGSQPGVYFVVLTFVYANGMRSLNFGGMQTWLTCYQQALNAACGPFNNTLYEQSITVRPGNTLKVASPTGLGYPFTAWGSRYKYPVGNVVLATSGPYRPVAYEVWVGTASGKEKLQTPSPIPIGTDWTMGGPLVAGEAMTEGWQRQTGTPIAMGTGWMEPSGGMVKGPHAPLVNNTVGTPVIVAKNNLLVYFSTGKDGIVWKRDAAYDTLANNFLGAPVEGGGQPPGFTDQANYDYSLTADSAARGFGADPGSTPEGDKLAPASQIKLWGLPRPGVPIPALAARTSAGGTFDAGAAQSGT